MTYRHSAVFAGVKATRERIKGNPTSFQLLTALDRLLMEACQPLVLQTNHVESRVAAALAWQETNRRRRISTLERGEFVPSAVTWMCLPSKELKAAHLPELRLDRAILSECCQSFLDALHPYIMAGNGTLRDPSTGARLPMDVQRLYRARVEEAFGASGSLNTLYREVTQSLTAYNDFAQAIMEKFHRMVAVTAQREYTKNFDHRVPLDEIIQSHMLAARRALDRCDPTKGVITVHIVNWMKTSHQSLLAADSESRSLSTTEDLSETIACQDPSAEETMEAEQDRDELRYLARLADPVGAGRAFLGLTESRRWILEQFAALNAATR